MHTNGNTDGPISPVPPTYQARLDQLRKALYQCLAEANHTQAQPLAAADPAADIDAETEEDRAWLVFDELWSTVARIAAEHADDGDSVSLHYLQLIVNKKRFERGHHEIHILTGQGVACVPVLGTVVADAKLGNRVEYFLDRK